LYDDGHGYCYSCNYYQNGKGAPNNIDYTYEYLPRRGISKRTHEFYGVLSKIDAEGKPVAVGYPYAGGKWHKVRKLDKKEFYSDGTVEPGLFGKEKFAAGSAKAIVITEGEDDALSLYEVLNIPVCSVQSSSSALRDCTVDRDYITSFQHIYLAFDNDEPGRQALRSVTKLFDYTKTFVLEFSNRKDANDYLRVGEADELRNIYANARKYLPEQIISSLAEFEKILKQPPAQGVPYPFRTLTEMTYGIRPGESVLLTAQEGVGKTELMHTIEHHLLKETDHAIGAIYLEEPKRRHLQALAGLELRRPVHLPDCGVSDSEQFAALQNLVGTDERLYLYSHFGSDDPEVLLDYIRFLVAARNCTFVLFDHVSMAVSGLAGDDERRALDYIATRLEMMVKELNFALIFVSHVNDLGQTRGSRYLSKVADIRIDATRDVLSNDPDERNTVNLVISKNRFSGKTGAAGRLKFDHDTWTFKEESLEWQLNPEKSLLLPTGMTRSAPIAA
jgi:twinkle protein